MSWRKYFTKVTTKQSASGTHSPFSTTNSYSKPGPAKTNYSSLLPDLYIGAPNRIQRYYQYETMDLDSEVNAALDILAEFCTQTNKLNNTPFIIDFEEQSTNAEITVIQQYLKQWCKLQQFETKIFRIVRNTFKYGDQIFIRDPETKRLFYVDPSNVSCIIVNESDGKTPEQYIIKNINFNFVNGIATTPIKINSTMAGNGANQYDPKSMVGSYQANSPNNRFNLDDSDITVDAEHIVHFSLSEGLDNNYPFGNSLLDIIFKVYKQKELLEDAIIIYRVQRAPERRVFYVDVGSLPTHIAMQFVERFKNEIHQRRIPSSTGGGQSVIDSAYNPLSMSEDYFFPQTCLALDQKIKLTDKRNLTLDELILEYKQGYENWTFSVNQKTLKMELGKIVWAGKTRLNTQLIEVTLSNNSTVKTTLDHRFIMHDGSEVEAQHLKPNDKIYSFISKNDDPYHVVSTQILDGLYDTGDITIESLSGAHNFALSCNVFVHNSEGRGSKVDTLPGGCLAMNTNVSLLDGRNLSIVEIEQELEQGNTLWTYSVDPETHTIAPGLISWAGVTQESAIVMQLTFDNGESIICTPDHKFPIIDKGFVRADMLSINETMMSFHHNKEEIDKYKNVDVQQFFNTDSDLWSDFCKNNNLNDRTLIDIKYLENKIPVGTLTIDNNEIYHNYHTFALSCGVFTKNSNLGEIDDLRYFTNKLVRALRIPSSYLPTGADDSNSQYNDGRVGTAYIQELRFNTYCERLQNLLITTFDDEFKRYVLEKGVNIDPTMFRLKFQPPQNFAAYRQSEIDNARVPTFTQMAAIPYISNRFALKRFLGITDEELAENERLWQEENNENLTLPEDASNELQDIGISSAGINADISNLDAELPVEGGEPAPTEEIPTETPPPPAEV